MLRRLAIKNLAIVEDLELELGDGLTVLTGETGAGKSILVDALLLLGGGRGSSDLVRQGAERLVVAGEFDADGSVRGLLEEAGLPSSDRILVKRELSPEGRGRAFVEDEPAAIRTLARLGERLLTIHGQNSELELADRSAALELLDAFANAQDEVGEVAAAAARWAEARKALEALEASRRSVRSRRSRPRRRKRRSCCRIARVWPRPIEFDAPGRLRSWPSRKARIRPVTGLARRCGHSRSWPPSILGNLLTWPKQKI